MIYQSIYYELKAKKSENTKSIANLPLNTYICNVTY